MRLITKKRAKAPKSREARENTEELAKCWGVEGGESPLTNHKGAIANELLAFCHHLQEV